MKHHHSLYLETDCSLIEHPSLSLRRAKLLAKRLSFGYNEIVRVMSLSSNYNSRSFGEYLNGERVG
jgi:hypothetical protein